MRGEEGERGEVGRGEGMGGGDLPRTCSFLRLFLHVVTLQCQRRFVLFEGRGGREVGGGAGGDKREVSGVGAGGGGCEGYRVVFSPIYE